MQIIIWKLPIWTYPISIWDPHWGCQNFTDSLASEN